jgi:hypothetical protein
MELIINGQYVEYHLQSLSASEYQSFDKYCKGNFLKLGYKTKKEAIESFLPDAWAHSAGINKTFTPYQCL